MKLSKFRDKDGKVFRDIVAATKEYCVERDEKFPTARCIWRTWDGYCAKHSERDYREPCVDGPCHDEELMGVKE